MFDELRGIVERDYEVFFEKNPELRSRTVSYRAFSIQDM